jgi:hypothetical protein
MKEEESSSKGLVRQHQERANEVVRSNPARRSRRLGQSAGVTRLEDVVCDETRPGGEENFGGIESQLFALDTHTGEQT